MKEKLIYGTYDDSIKRSLYIELKNGSQRIPFENIVRIVILEDEK